MDLHYKGSEVKVGQRQESLLKYSVPESSSSILEQSELESLKGLLQNDISDERDRAVERICSGIDSASDEILDFLFNFVNDLNPGVSTTIVSEIIAKRRDLAYKCYAKGLAGSYLENLYSMSSVSNVVQILRFYTNLVSVDEEMREGALSNGVVSECLSLLDRISKDEIPDILPVERFSLVQALFSFFSSLFNYPTFLIDSTCSFFVSSLNVYSTLWTESEKSALHMELCNSFASIFKISTDSIHISHLLNKNFIDFIVFGLNSDDENVVASSLKVTLAMTSGDDFFSKYLIESRILQAALEKKLHSRLFISTLRNMTSCQDKEIIFSLVDLQIIDYLFNFYDSYTFSTREQMFLTISNLMLQDIISPLALYEKNSRILDLLVELLESTEQMTSYYSVYFLSCLLDASELRATSSFSRDRVASHAVELGIYDVLERIPKTDITDRILMLLESHRRFDTLQD